MITSYDHLIQLSHSYGRIAVQADGLALTQQGIAGVIHSKRGNE
jgi:hypothetical protein